MEFTMNDLRSGDVVELRSGRRYVIFVDYQHHIPIRGIGCIEDTGWMDFRNYEDGMTNPNYSDLDIMKVLRAKAPHVAPWSASDDKLDVVFDRNGVKELTVAEISKLLGYTVKVIEG